MVSLDDSEKSVIVIIWASRIYLWRSFRIRRVMVLLYGSEALELKRHFQEKVIMPNLFNVLVANESPLIKIPPKNCFVFRADVDCSIPVSVLLLFLMANGYLAQTAQIL